jgi:L-alanine-DL-glutamate epimerase-like enolase superfamily enzyme
LVDQLVGAEVTENEDRRAQDIQGPAWQADLFQTELKIEAGFAALPAAPGLGLGFDEAEAARHPYVPDFRPEWRWEDGSVADW